MFWLRFHRGAEASTGRLHPDFLGVVAAQSQVVAADFDFDRIAERGETDQLHGRTDQQAHFEQTTALIGAEFDFANGASSADFQRGQGLGHHKSSDLLPGKGLDEDFIGQTSADAQAGVANLADQVALTAEELDFLFLAEAHLAQPMSQLRRGGQLLDAHGHAGIDMAQRAQERLRTRTIPVVARLLRWRLRLLHVWNVGQLRLSCKRELGIEGLQANPKLVSITNDSA